MTRETETSLWTVYAKSGLIVKTTLGELVRRKDREDLDKPVEEEKTEW